MSDDADYMEAAAEIERLLADKQWAATTIIDRNTEIKRLRAENERLRAALAQADAAINPPDRNGISLEQWNVRLKAATTAIRAVLTRGKE